MVPCCNSCCRPEFNFFFLFDLHTRRNNPLQLYIPQDDDTWLVNHFVDSKLGCNAVCWAPLNCIGYRDETGREYMHLVTGSCDNRVKV